MNPTPARGLPPRIYIPIVVAVACVVLGVVGYFLKVALATPGSAIGEGTPSPAASSSAGGAQP
ncbi:MAG TPA: hypothetical protein VME66_00105 [Candidatus Acidoferrales bacterium]|nr:hypothetical protein [Candidatus Acidoferrales bacterium]